MKKFIFFIIILSILFITVPNSLAKVTRTDRHEILISGQIVTNDYLNLKLIFNKNKHIDDWTIELNSPGGQVQAGIAMINTILEQIKKGKVITTVVKSEAASMAAYIFLTGQNRIIYEGASVMLHKAFQINKYGTKITPAKSSDAEKILKMMNDFFIKLMKKYYDNDVEKIDKLLEDSIRYNAKELFEIGIATKYINLID